MRIINIVSALILLTLSALVALETWHLPYWTQFAPGPSFASIWVAAAGAAIGGALLIHALRTADPAPAEWPDRAGGRQVLLGAAALWLLFALLPWLGTALSGLIFMLIFLLGVARRAVVPSVVTSIATVALIESVFGVWLNIDLPGGIVGF